MSLRLPRAPVARTFTLTEHPFSRSYGANLPSSLARVISSVSAFSACLPVLDCGTSTYLTSPPRLFLVSVASISSSHLRGIPLTSPPYQKVQGTGLDQVSHHLADLASCVTAGLLLRKAEQALSRWGRNINRLPIAYAFRPQLRVSPNPGRINLPQETLDFRRPGFSPEFSLLMPA